MEQYLDLIRKIKEEGEVSGDRTGTGTKRIFGHYMSFDCSEKFPLVTTKYTHFHAIVHELLWFLSGSTNIKYLVDNDVGIWNEWADDAADVGPLYGAQWRNAGGKYRREMHGHWVQDGIDQLQSCINLINDKPTSRRIIVDCWNVRYLPDEAIPPQNNVGIGLMALAPCHMMYQFFVHNDDTLDITMYQRSVDTFLGLPFNIASYALLLHLVAQVTNKKVGTLNWVGGDVHLYNNHARQVEELLSRKPLELPTVEINSQIKDINDFLYGDIKLVNYNHQGRIKADISV